jgi:protein-tyrosine phosphatase
MVITITIPVPITATNLTKQMKPPELLTMYNSSILPPPMADMHSHILPNVDDGASNLEDALEILWKAVNDGVMIQILTPHIHQPRYNNTRKSLEIRFLEFCDLVMEAGIPIELRLAAEIHVCHEIMQMVDNDEIPWLGEFNGEKSFLLEFPQNTIPAGSENLIIWLRRNRILPVIAHPERNLIFQRFPDKMRSFIDHDCPLQITASSLTGHFGKSAMKLAHSLLKEGKVRVLASDCHNLRFRPPNLSQGLEVAAKLVGKSTATEMVSSNVLDLVAGDTHRLAKLG